MRFTIPNQLTILRVLLTPFFIYYFLSPDPIHQLLATVIFCFASFTDWYDGWYARRFAEISRFGQFADPLADKILVSSALIVFAMMGFIKTWMVWVIIIRDFAITFSRVYALAIGRPIITSVLAKWKTTLQMLTIFTILFLFNLQNFSGNMDLLNKANYQDPVGIMMIVVTALTVISGLIYIIENRDLIITFFRSFFP